MTRHAELVRAVLVACNRLPGVFLFPIDVVRAPDWKRTRGMAGTSDILGWIERDCQCNSDRDRRCDCLACCDGQPRRPIFVALEIKVSRDTLRPEQRAFLDKVQAAGGIALEIRDVMQAVEALK